MKHSDVMAGFVDRAEGLNRQLDKLRAEAREHGDSIDQINWDKLLDDILEQRRIAHLAREEALALIGSADWVDDGTGNFVPADEVAA